MSAEFYERIVVVVLSVLLITGTVILGRKYSARPLDITLIKDAAGERLTLGQVEEALRAGRKVDINSSAVSDIVSIPGIGKKMAARIIDYRRENGGFSSIDELRNIRGIGRKKLERIRDYVTVNGEPYTSHESRIASHGP